jgi:2-polyprenyl-3-methyl-5-hydroxy-6-metoxy-1,4-benzoquinol methylase
MKLSTIYTQASTDCSICGSPTEPILDLPNLPMTGRFSENLQTDVPPGVDQQFLFCQNCLHGQLSTIVDPAELYDSTYNFRTSSSEHSKSGTEYFLSSLEELLPGKQFRCVLDIGCNDLYLLREMGDRAKTKVGIDPIWAGIEHEIAEQDISVIGTGIESKGLKDKLPEAPDLIILRHTIEHLENPAAVIDKINELASDDCYIVLEMPSLETMLSRARFDLIYHHHLQYFSIRSSQRLADKAGLTLVAAKYLQANGALFIVMSKKSDTHQMLPEIPDFGTDSSIFLRDRFVAFKNYLETTKSIFESMPANKAFGYGAAELVPNLFHHSGIDPAIFSCVLDDDPTKDGMYYWNLPLQIRTPGAGHSLADSKVMITALEHIRPIVSKLSSQNPPLDIVIPAIVF